MVGTALNSESKPPVNVVTDRSKEPISARATNANGKANTKPRPVMVFTALTLNVGGAMGKSHHM